MPTIVGTLQVDLVANTATFTADLGKAGKGLDDFGKSASDAGKAVDFSMQQAKGGLMLAEESIGVHLPRHLNALIAQIPGVGAAFANMLPVLGVLAAITIIVKLIEKHEELAIAIHKAAIENENLEIKQGDTVKTLELTNLKLDDQIAKLEGRPTKNRIKEALIEASVAVDKLAESFGTDFQRIDSILIDATTLTSRFWEGLKSGTNLSALVSGVPQVQAELGKVTHAMAVVDGIRLKLAKAPAGTDEWKHATLELAGAYEGLAIVSERALKTVGEYSKDNTKLISALTQTATIATDAYKDIGLEVEATQKKTKVAALENIADENAKAAAQQKGLDHYIKVQAEYAKKQEEAHKKAVEEAERTAAEEIAATNAVAAINRKNAEDEVRRNQEIWKSEEQLAIERIKLKASTGEEGVRGAASLAVISAQDEQKQLQAIYTKELTDLRNLYAAEKTAQEAFIAQQKALAASSPTGSEAQRKALDEADKAQKRLNTDTQHFLELEAGISKELTATNTSLSKLQSSWHNYFLKMGAESKHLGTEIRTNLQGNLDHAINSFSTGFAKMIVEGQDFGKAMKQLGVDVAESFISMLTQMALEWLISHIIMGKSSQVTSLGEIIDAAAVAGAQGTASFAGAPWPIDMGAPAFGAAMMATTMSYAGMLAHAEKGAFIDAPLGTAVPIMAHGQELVLPSGLSKGLSRLVESKNNGRPINVKMAVQTPNADSFRMSSTQTTGKLHREITRISRRNN